MAWYASAMTSGQGVNPKHRSYCWVIMVIYRQMDITFTIVLKEWKELRFTDVSMYVVSL